MSEQKFHCYNLRRLRGEVVVCGKWVATGDLGADGWVRLYCPRCNQPLVFPRAAASRRTDAPS